MILQDPPNRLSTVLEVGARDSRWKSPSWDEVRHFARAVVRELRKTDTRWGLNYKRGGPEISADVVAYYYGPTDRDCRLVDIVAAATGANPRLYWGVIADDGTGALRWTLETLYEGIEGPPPPPPPPPPPTTVDLSGVYDKLDAIISQQEDFSQHVARLNASLAEIRTSLTQLAYDVRTARDWAYDAKVEATNAARRISALINARFPAVLID